MPYHSPNGGDHRGSPNGGDHRGRDRDHGGRGWDHGRHHDRDRFVFFGLYGWGYPVWPWWGWGSPFLPSYWNSWDDYDSQPASNYAATQPYPEYSPGPYEAAPPQDSDPQQSEPAPTSTPWPYSQPAPSGYAGAPSAAGPEAPLTLVFKDGRPNQQIRNYLMTAKTLSVLDQQRRDIPVDQIDLAATAKVNRAAGVEFSIPGSGE